MNAHVPSIALVAGAYLLGSVPFGLIAGWLRGVDIRTIGSGNIGATNVARALGKPWAIAVLLADAAKGFLPVAVAELLERRFPGRFPPAAIAAAGLGAICGHMFAIFLRGRGGKGVATSLGVALALSPLLAALCFGVYAVAYAATRLSSVGSLLGIWCFPIAAAIQGHLPAAHVALSVVVAILVTARHHENIRRLLRGEEKRA